MEFKYTQGNKYMSKNYMCGMVTDAEKSLL